VTERIQSDARLSVGVLGPVLRRALRRLARARAEGLMRVGLRRRRRDHREFGVLDHGRRLAQAPRQDVAMAIDLAQDHVAPRFGLHDDAVDPLKGVEFDR